MKKFFLGISLLSAFTLVKAQTADEIVSKNISAVGGKTAIESIQNLVMEGSMDVQGATITIKATKVPGKLARQDMSVMGQNAYSVVTDKDGWAFYPFAGQAAPVEVTGDDLKEAQQEMRITDDLYNYAANGTKLELQGKEDVNGTECFKLKVTTAAGKESTYYIDPATFYVVRVSQTKKMMGQEIPVTIDYSDYKDVNGMKLPFTVGTPQGSITFSSIKANQTIDPKVYTHE